MEFFAWVFAALSALSVILSVAVRFRIIQADLQPGTLLSLATVGFLAAIFFLDASPK